VPDPAKRAEHLERLKGEAERLAHLVENVLFYARIESGRARASVEPVALRPLVERHAETLRDRAARLGLRLEVSAERIEATAAVSADPGGVEQILTNLVDNACKYAAAGGVVRLQLSDRGDRAEVLVEDDGPGLSRRDRRRLFRPFSKSDREAAASAPGIGLGLALSRRLARAMGGELRLDPDYRSGAAFVLSLRRLGGSSSRPAL